MNAWVLILIFWTGGASSVSIEMLDQEACMEAGSIIEKMYKPNSNIPRVDYWYCVDRTTGGVVSR